MKRVSDRWVLTELQRPVAPDYHPGPHWPSLDEEDFFDTISIVQERWMLLAVPWDDLINEMDYTLRPWGTRSLHEEVVWEAIQLCRYHTGSNPTAVFLDYNDYQRMAKFEGITIIT
jgi:hypothetical protein